MRQREDCDFVSTLITLSKGTLTNEDLTLFKRRECKPKNVRLVTQSGFLQQIKLLICIMNILLTKIKIKLK